jgi:condensin-2 complex subunit H2
MVEADEADLKENRFSYLLQPIRDLAANWDINIAGELEEYLDELENLTFTIEGCVGPSLNFAEAALLIQVQQETRAYASDNVGLLGHFVAKSLAEQLRQHAQQCWLLPQRHIA